MPNLADQLEKELPFLRRYARALSGSQTIGDDLAYQTLQAIQADRHVLNMQHSVRIGLFQVFYQKWVASGRQSFGDETASKAKKLLSDLAPDSREALLLATLEGCTLPQISFILSTPPETVAALLKQATRDMQSEGSGKILVIEDEAIIAADLTRIVEQAGHRVMGVARTHKEAVALAERGQPDLILADIQLADGSSGIDAVTQILSDFGTLPVIFITAFPQLLLTGVRPEPAFLITKPFTNDHVTSAVSQAMFFASTQTLDVLTS